MPKDARIVVHPDVVLLETEGGGVLHAPRRDLYYALNETGVLLWRCLATYVSEKDAIESFVTAASDTEGDAASVRTFAEDFIKDGVRERLLCRKGRPARGAAEIGEGPPACEAFALPENAPPGLARQLLWFVVVSAIAMGSRVVGTTMLVGIARSAGMLVPGARGLRRNRISLDVTAIDRAIKVVRPDNSCVCRAVAYCMAFRRHRICGKLCLGIKVLPFEAHAWVEVGGRAVHEDVLVLQRYRVTARH